MKKAISIILMMLLSLLLLSCEQKYYNEWIDNLGKRNYYNELGEKLINCYARIDGDIYFFDDKGNLLTDTIVNYENEQRILFPNGKLNKDTGLRLFKNNWYYLKDGKIQIGTVKDGNNLYYFDGEGKMVSDDGWRYDDNKNAYVYIADGKTKTGWLKENDKWYYLLPSGYMCKDWNKVEGKWYFFDRINGDLKTSQWIDRVYYVNENGEMLHSGWYSINGQMLYFETDGNVNKNRKYESEMKQKPSSNSKNKVSSKENYAKKSSLAGNINYILESAYPIWNEFIASTNYSDKMIKSEILKSYGNTLCDICESAYTIDKYNNNLEGMEEDQIIYRIGLTFIGNKKWE